MGLFGFGKKKSWEEENAWDGSDPITCPRCGQPMTKRYNFSAWWCDNCNAGLNDDMDEEYDDSESLSVYDAAGIWASHGKDEDYMFGYSEEELENAL